MTEVGTPYGREQGGDVSAALGAGGLATRLATGSRAACARAALACGRPHAVEPGERAGRGPDAGGRGPGARGRGPGAGGRGPGDGGLAILFYSCLYGLETGRLWRRGLKGSALRPSSAAYRARTGARAGAAGPACPLRRQKTPTWSRRGGGLRVSAAAHVPAARRRAPRRGEAAGHDVVGRARRRVSAKRPAAQPCRGRASAARGPPAARHCLPAVSPLVLVRVGMERASGRSRRATSGWWGGARPCRLIATRRAGGPCREGLFARPPRRQAACALAASSGLAAAHPRLPAAPAQPWQVRQLGGSRAGAAGASGGHVGARQARVRVLVRAP